MPERRSRSRATPSRSRRPSGVGSRVVSASAPTVVSCASSTPPTGTWAGRSTARGCSRTRRPTSTTCSRSSSPSASTWSSSRATSTTARSRRSTPCGWPTSRWCGWPRSRAQVVLTSGNHDSAQRLGFSSRLIDAAGVFIRTDAAEGRHRPSRLADEHGPVAVYGLPFLDPLALAEPWQLPVRSHEAALADRHATAYAATSPPARPAPGRWCWPTPSWPAASPASPSATSASAACPGCRPACSTGSTTSPSATSTAPRCSPTGSATAGRRSPTPSPSTPRPRARGWSTSRPTAR